MIELVCCRTVLHGNEFDTETFVRGTDRILQNALVVSTQHFESCHLLL